MDLLTVEDESIAFVRNVGNQAWQHGSTGVLQQSCTGLKTRILIYIFH
jgi:hypothetical protein